LSLHEERLLKIAKPRSDEILLRHFALPDPTKIPPASLSGEAPHGSAPNNGSTVDWDGIRRKRLIYRSKQRGWLEVDLLLGTWASENVPQLSAIELDEFEAFVNLETIDIYNVITLRIDIPEDIRSGVVERIQQWARESPLGKADPAMYEQVKKGNNLI
jgi:succinate dehydrogenase flavin-adding protein (antitoxin of CptAB toxin-antitoxin module)